MFHAPERFHIGLMPFGLMFIREKVLVCLFYAFPEHIGLEVQIRQFRIYLDI